MSTKHPFGAYKTPLYMRKATLCKCKKAYPAHAGSCLLHQQKAPSHHTNLSRCTTSPYCILQEQPSTYTKGHPSTFSISPPFRCTVATLSTSTPFYTCNNTHSTSANPLCYIHLHPQGAPFYLVKSNLLDHEEAHFYIYRKLYHT